jgi:aminopeptidase N
MKTKYFLIFFLMISVCAIAQKKEKQFTHADTLRGTMNAERAWWNVLRYDITVEPDFENKSITGSNRITYKTVKENHPLWMQIDLQEPLRIDSIILNRNKHLSFTREGNAWHVKTVKDTINSVNEIVICYHGKPREAIHPPWDGGWTFTKDSLGRPWMTVTCQGLGASVWYPNKDHQSDEPNDGASLNMIVPNDLVAVSNGRLKEKKAFSKDKTSYTWVVENPINNYNIIPYIGKYVNFSETYLGIKGKLDLSYWVMDYNLEKARNYLPNEVHNMLDSFEYWFGPYPFYEDGYKLVETEHTGMEHQSAVAYGNHYKPGYRGRDLSGTGWGMKWDFIVVHESGHEWFGNNITSNDLADMYLHESFANYSETLFVESMYGKEAANEYNYGIRQGIQNNETIIPAAYGVNAQGSGDMYPKGGNMLHTIRHSINNDQLFRNILAGLNQTFYHQTVNGSQIQEYISKKAGYDYKNVFNQYLTTTQIPELNLYLNAKNDEVFYKWTSCIDEFDLPLSLNNSEESLKIIPTQKWQSIKVNNAQLYLFNPMSIEKMYYIKVKESQTMNY